MTSTFYTSNLLRVLCYKTLLFSRRKALSFTEVENGNTYTQLVTNINQYYVSRKSRAKVKMEWLPSTEEIKHWVKRVSAHQNPSSTTSSKQVVSDLKQYLRENNLYIGPATFTSGFISVVHEACSSDNINVVKFVLKHHAEKFDINQRIVYPYPHLQRHNARIIIASEETLVHAVVKSSSTKILKLLVSHGASVNIPDNSSVTPLLRAVNEHSPNKDFVSYLIKVGADIHCQDNKGQSVLMYAVRGTERPVKDIILLLLKAGADATLTDECGYNVLHHAVSDGWGCADNINVLLSAKIQSNWFPPTHKAHALFFADKINFFVDSDDFLCENSPEPRNNPKEITDVITKHPLCPPRLKVDSILVNATFSLYWNIYIDSPPADSIKVCYGLIKEGLTLQAKLKLPPPILSEPIEDYSGLSEVISIEELNEIYSDLTNTTTQVNLAYQCLIIRERCLGYGHFTVVSSLFMYGGWMIVLDHFSEGLSLWVRGTLMLLSRFKEGIRSEQSDLFFQIKNGYYCISKRMDKLLKGLQEVQDLSTKLEAIVSNLIECQRMSLEMLMGYNEVNYYIEVDDRLVSFYNWKNCLRLLDSLSKNPLNSLDVTSLCQQVIAKCPVFPIGSKLHIDVLDIALSGYERRTLSDCFLSILLESGGDAFVNKVGWTGYRPLNLVQTKEATSLLLAHGAHLDAVNKPDQYVHVSTNPYLDDYFLTPLPLACLSAKCIVSESIPYQSIGLPCHVVEFIVLHDLDGIKLNNSSIDDLLFRKLNEFWY